MTILHSNILLLDGDAEGLATVLRLHDIHAGVLDDLSGHRMEIFNTASREGANHLALGIKDVVVLFGDNKVTNLARKSGRIFRIHICTFGDILLRLIFINWPLDASAESSTTISTASLR